jgi:hypothetical protein
LADDKFIILGSRCHITFNHTDKNSEKAWQYLNVEEGRYESNEFKPLPILNGDETDFGDPHFGEKPSLLQTTLIAR